MAQLLLNVLLSYDTQGAAAHEKGASKMRMNMETFAHRVVMNG